MSTVGAVIERLFRTYLYPPDQRPPMAHLDTTVTSSVTSVVLTSFMIPEDELLMAAGVVLECEQELMQVTAYDDATLTATVLRGVMGTTAAAHSADTPILLSPPYPRMSVFEAVADNIITLSPRLFTIGVENMSAVTGNVFPMPDPLAVSIVSAWPDQMSDVAVDCTIVDFHPAVGSRALITNIDCPSLWVRYHRRMGEATSEADTLVSLGVEPRWVNIIMAGAAADLMAGRDIPQVHADWIGKSFEAEAVPIGTRSTLARGLRNYHSYLIDHAEREMKAEYKARVHMRRTAQVITRSPFG